MKNYCDLVINDLGRECSRCFQFKEWTEYHRCKNGSHGRYSFCKECRKNKVPAKHYQHKIDDYGRTCAKCKKYLPWSEYYSHKGCPNDKHSRCKECAKIDTKLRTFHITQQEYNRLLEKCNNVCEICKLSEKHTNGHGIQSLGIDHCHQTGNVRGILCCNCNRGIGLANDSIVILDRMIEYIESNISFQPVKRRPTSHKIENMMFGTYGIGHKEYNYILEQQNNVCAICHQSEIVINSHTGDIQKLAIDHDHNTGLIRGLLCTKCNNSLGCFQDSVQIMQSAIEYLNH